ncbi:MAG TPA: hypothetical protein VHB73_08240, partial [Alphaproteobacteria bacterium]|nr:hypothetical protein [Alphaproteobacteria bacterium]
FDLVVNFRVPDHHPDTRMDIEEERRFQTQHGNREPGARRALYNNFLYDPEAHIAAVELYLKDTWEEKIRHDLYTRLPADLRRNAWFLPIKINVDKSFLPLDAKVEEQLADIVSALMERKKPEETVGEESAPRRVTAASLRNGVTIIYKPGEEELLSLEDTESYQAFFERESFGMDKHPGNNLYLHRQMLGRYIEQSYLPAIRARLDYLLVEAGASEDTHDYAGRLYMEVNARTLPPSKEYAGSEMERLIKEMTAKLDGGSEPKVVEFPTRDTKQRITKIPYPQVAMAAAD